MKWLFQPPKSQIIRLEFSQLNLIRRDIRTFNYRSGTVNSKSFVSQVLLRIKWKFELINAL